MVRGSEATSQGYTMSELDRKRNEFIKVKQLAEEYWPKDTASYFNQTSDVNVPKQLGHQIGISRNK